MIETRPMTVEDMLLIMALNEDIYSDFAKLPEELKRYVVIHNIIHDAAKYFYDKGRLVGVGGIKYVGVGEAWMISYPEIRSEHGLALVKQAQETFIGMRDEKNLWQVFAESRISENFLKRLGFKQNPKGFVWIRH